MSDKKVPRCFQCQEIVTFDPARRGKNGRMIPLDPSTNQPHQCKDQEAKAEVVERMYTPETEQELQHPQPAVVEVKEKAATMKRITTTLHKTFHDIEAFIVDDKVNAYTNKARNYVGGQVHGVTTTAVYDPDIKKMVYISVAHVEVPNAAVAELDKEE